MDPFEEEQEEVPSKPRKSWAEIRAAYWKSPWYKNFYFVMWKDVVIFLLAVLLIFSHWYDAKSYGDVAAHPCNYCNNGLCTTGAGGDLWNEGNGTATLMDLSNTSLTINQKSK